MAEGPGNVPPPGPERLLWKVSASFAVACLALSWLGFNASLEESNPWWKPLEALYASFQLLLLHISFDELPPEGWPRLVVHIARVLAVIFTFATTFALGFTFFGKQFLRIMRGALGDHTVICGYNRIGRQLAIEFSHDRPVVIDIRKDGAETGKSAGEDIGLLEGNPADPRVLSLARVGKAARLFAALDDDGANVGIAVQAIKLAKKKSDRPHILVHIADPQLRATLRSHAAFTSGDGMPRVSMFNVFENSARLLLRNHQLDYERISETGQRTVQLVVIGFGLMGEAIVTRAALVGHYANLKPVRIIVIDRHAARKGRLFRARYQQLHHVVEAHFLELDAEEPSTQARIAELCADATETLSTVVISFDNDSQALSLASSMVDQLDQRVPIRVRLNDESGLADLRLPAQISVFGTMHHACARENWIDDKLDRMARALHNDHVRRVHETRQARPGDPSLRKWEQLNDDLIDSNRQAADHIWVKLRALDYHAAERVSGDPGVLITELNTQQIELLARMEHQRWMAERFMAGWSYGPEKDTPNRISPYLVPWDEVPDNVQEYDRDFARILPHVLKLGGWEIRRNST